MREKQNKKKCNASNLLFKELDNRSRSRKSRRPSTNEYLKFIFLTDYKMNNLHTAEKLGTEGNWEQR
jgi:hypothetical protein